MKRHVIFLDDRMLDLTTIQAIWPKDGHPKEWIVCLEGGNNFRTQHGVNLIKEFRKMCEDK